MRHEVVSYPERVDLLGYKYGNDNYKEGRPYVRWGPKRVNLWDKSTMKILIKGLEI